MSLYRPRRRPRARRRLLTLLERLEPRWLLAASLSVSDSAVDTSTVLVRLHPEARPAAPASDVDQAVEVLPGLWRMSVPEGLGVDESIQFFENYPGMIYAEPNYQVQLSATASDPDYDRLWGLRNLGQTGGTPGIDIGVEQAWEVTTGSASTLIAVIDTGVDYRHPDLAANIWVNPGEIADDGIDNDGNGFVDDLHGYDFAGNDGDPLDDHNHGTHVAGTIGAVANNGIGIAGVNWDVQIMAVKFLNSRGSGSIADAVSAIHYAVDNGATVSNHSWGFNGGYSQSLADAISYAQSAGHVVVAAAGNGGGDGIGDDNDQFPFYPSAFEHDNLLSVAATDHNDQLGSFSNYGHTQVDLGAPGVGIYSTTRNNTYSTFNGTSMATPHVTGAVALLQSQYPQWSYQEVRDRIFDTVDLVPALQGKTTTGGRLNAAAAVRPDLLGPAVIASTPATDQMHEVSRVTLAFNEKIDATSFTTDDVVSFQGPQGAITVDEINLVTDSGGRQFEIVFAEQAALGDYTLTIGPDILDTSANPMDQNGDAEAGQVPDDQYIATFRIIPDTVGPAIVTSTPNGPTNLPTSRVQVTFDERIDANSFTVEDIVAFHGPSGPIPIIGLQALSDGRYEIEFPYQDALGNYSMTIGPQILDRAGNPMDQDRDGVGGETDDDAFEIQFNLEVWQYADHVVEFSSQYSSTDWSAEQSLGPPDTFAYGDIETAWAPLYANGTDEFLTVGFERPLLASGVSIRETYGNGFVRGVEVRDATTGHYVTVSTGPDPSQPNQPVDYVLSWPQTEFPVDAVRIAVDTDHNLDAYEEIDSVQLRGVTVPDVDGPRVIDWTPDGSAAAPLSRIQLEFDEAIQDGTFALDDLTHFSGPAGDVTATAVNRLSSSVYEILFPPQDTFGNYSLVIGPQILDLQGLPMNQDQDGTDGESIEDQFELDFRVELWQYASSVVDFSSQYATTSWSAAQAIGDPDTFVYGDSRTAWTPGNRNGTTENLTVAFPTAVLASGVVIRETFGNGFVTQVEVRDAETGVFEIVSTGSDGSQPGSPVDHLVAWPETSYPVDAVRIQIGTDHSAGYEQIDAVQLRGVTAPDLRGPRIISTTPDLGHPGPIDHIELTFSEPIAVSSFTTADVLRLDGPVGSIEPISVQAISETTFQIAFASQTTKGTYSLEIGSEISDLAGNLLDQNEDQIGGQTDDRFNLSFELELWQHASTVLGFSSQYSATSWSADQALGVPDTFVYGDQRTAWTPKSSNGTTEWLSVGFDTPVLSSGVIIRQTYGNGFVRQIEVRDAESGLFHQMPMTIDESQPGAPVDFDVSWPLTDFPVDAVKVTIDTNHSLGFEEIDAIQLRGVIAPDVSGPRVIATDPQQGHPGSIEQVDLIFSEPIDPQTFTAADVIELSGPTGPIAIAGIDQLAEDRYRIRFDLQTEFGTYSLLVDPSIRDLAGNLMDQNQDGVGGQVDDRFALEFDLELWQDASTVIDFSSQYSTLSWSAAQSLGPADTFVYGDQRTTWTPKSSNGTVETLTVGFETPVLSTGAIIRETFGNGFVRAVEVRDAETGLFQTMDIGEDDSQPGTPVDYNVSWPMTEFAVDAVRITIDTDHSLGFEQIDSVRLRGVVAPDVVGPRVIQTNPQDGHPGSIDKIDLLFSEPIAEGSLTAGDIVALSGPNGAIPVNGVETLAADQFRIHFDRQTQFGSYQLVLGTQVTDLAGNLLDQNGDGIGGQNDDLFELQFDLELWQYAASVVDFSSQYSTSSWSAAQAVGPADTFVYADQRTAWVPKSRNGTSEFLTVGFQTPVFATGAIIRETFGNGFVRQVEVRNAATGEFEIVSIGPDNSQPGTPVDFSVSWNATSYLVDALRITVDTNHSLSYEEIDAVQLRGK
ncbi:S8 family serine peptidase [Stieleria sp. TO1_6]|uniref:S8 family serine peptidase n=1 Tax=Stieleria tagensis TaxID=2956795 RepID=UPI00209A80CE|nr:S8 family serine peptidase [Stieleria tagensis]MCO8121989.1 S8 family serine peptidase [Stieleria tagensis]